MWWHWGEKEMSSACIEHRGSSAGRRLYIPVRYNYSSRYNILPEDEHSDSKHVVDIVRIEMLL